jgi:excisionase family DNA binding protein
MAAQATPDRAPLTREDVLGLTQAAELLGVPRSTLADLARRGDVPAVKLGRRWVFRRSLLDVATRPPVRHPLRAAA